MRDDDFLRAWGGVQPGLLRVARLVYRHAEDAEDAVSDVCLALLQSSSATPDNLDRLAFGILWNQFRTACKRRVRVRHGIPPDAAFDPEVHAGVEWNRRIDALDERQANAIRLRSVGCDYQEIADAMGVPITTVNHLIAEARRKLRDEQDPD